MALTLPEKFPIVQLHCPLYFSMMTAKLEWLLEGCFPICL